MRKSTVLLLVIIISCHTEKKQPDDFPEDEGGDNVWIVYEGRVPLTENASLYIEVSLRPSEKMDEGSYQLAEFLDAENGLVQISAFKGKYSTVYGERPEDLIIQFHGSAQAKGLRRSYLHDKGYNTYLHKHTQVVREDFFRKTDLTLKTRGKNKLIVLDQNLLPLSSEWQFNLWRRTSKLFTVEGYFRHVGDTADFLEMNTREQWAVSKLGQYAQAASQYHQLVTDKSERTYLKAIGYSVTIPNREGKDTEALVLKKILQMTSTPATTEEYNQISP